MIFKKERQVLERKSPLARNPPYNWRLDSSSILPYLSNPLLSIAYFMLLLV
jgi:hypothetical protein